MLKLLMLNNNNGTITDISTRLMWQQEACGKEMTCYQAEKYCKKLNLGGYSDWRLPTIKELNSLVNYDEHDPSIDTSMFPSTKPFKYWTSTKRQDIGYNWIVDFGSGGNGASYKQDLQFVRAVREMSDSCMK